MKGKVLIVEDQGIEAMNLKRMLTNAGYEVCGIARSVDNALSILSSQLPDLVLLDIFLKGPLTGIDLAYTLKERNIAFIYLSANSNESTLDAAKATCPHGFLVKPIREKDILVMLEIAHYNYKNSLQTLTRDPAPPQPAGSKKPAPTDHFSGIIGKTPGLQKTLQHLQLVAPSDTTVLILGESGTGKERIADCIHQLSPRKERPLIKVNCAALPSTLIESILFGHERGAFTGAIERRIGKFEQAHNGTLFLDEIGEISPEVQAKLLRALQENEIERLSGREIIKLNVRVIAATNKNLEKETAEGRFRLDLYYRINVFPLTMPALRERKEDIPDLVTHFITRFCAKAGKGVLTVAPVALDQLQRYSWPGNIRELEHLIERSVLLADSNTITHIPLPAVQLQDPGNYVTANDLGIKTIDDMEKEHILNILKFCKGRVAGTGGAAELLGVPVSTLNSKMSRLGIKREHSLQTGKK